MKKLIIIALLAIATAANAQEYKTALGLRAGAPFGFTIKHFVAPKFALEGIVSPRYAGAELVGLLEYHVNAFGVEGFRWYFGGGMHLGAYGHHKRFDNRDGGVYIGIDGIGGLEYNFKPVPINISVDLKPAINFTPEPDLWPDAGISVRYYFGK
jgi:hypothetical protein